MNVIIKSDVPQDVTLRFEFTDGKKYSTVCTCDGYEDVTAVVVGRWPKDVIHMGLEHGDYHYEMPVVPDSSGLHLKPINLSGKRDYWSQLLRDKALEITGKHPQGGRKL